MSFSNMPGSSLDASTAYVNACLELLGDNNPLEVMKSTPDQLFKALDAVPAHVHIVPEANEKWSIVEVVQHLADSEIVYGYRMRLIVAEDQPEIPGYDQNVWATNLRYRNVDSSDALEDFRYLRAMNIRWIAGLHESEFTRWGLHSERGKESVHRITELLAAHDLIHLNQIKRIAAGLSMK